VRCAVCGVCVASLSVCAVCKGACGVACKCGGVGSCVSVWGGNGAEMAKEGLSAGEVRVQMSHVWGVAVCGGRQVGSKVWVKG